MAWLYKKSTVILFSIVIFIFIVLVYLILSTINEDRNVMINHKERKHNRFAIIETIPDVNAEVFDDVEIKPIGYSNLLDCVENKVWCVYGDSTLEENIHDIVVLLSRLNSTTTRDYFKLINILQTKKRIQIGNVIIDLQNDGLQRVHRIMTVEVKDRKFTLIHRFTGHNNINSNCEGITALSSFLLENLSFLKSNCTDILINSAAHDWSRGKGWLENYYIQNVKKIVDFTKSLTNDKKQVNIYWKGNAWYAFQDFDGYGMTSYKDQMFYEKQVQNALNNTHIRFINVSHTLSLLPLMSKKYLRKIHPKARSPWFLNFPWYYAPFYSPWPHIGQAGVDLSISGSLFWTSMVTQTILNEMCTRPVVVSEKTEDFIS